MEKLTSQFVEYVSKMAGLPAVWGASLSKPLPQYLAQQYALRKITIGGRTFLGILLKDDTDFRPSAFIKHLRQLMPDTAGLDGYCLITQDLPGYTRRRLIERQIPFVMPGQQMYWPELGLAAQARKTKKTPAPVKTLSPAAQAVLIHALNGNMPNPVTPKVLAEELDYAGMTMTRALDEIEANNLGQLTRNGRERLLHFPEDHRTLWQAALPYMRNPVRETVRVKEDELPPDCRIKAGETAIADLSRLAPPREPVYALGRQTWKKLANTVELIPIEDDGACRVQLWRYDPALFAGDGRVDPFSLYLSLREEQDERIESALEEMMGNLVWS